MFREAMNQGPAFSKRNACYSATGSELLEWHVQGSVSLGASSGSADDTAAAAHARALQVKGLIIFLSLTSCM